MRTGTIEGFGGSWGSGIAVIRIDGQTIPCENAPTVRALASFIPGVIGPGHTVNVKAIIGQEVAWEMDEMGLMLGAIGPADYDEGE